MLTLQQVEFFAHEVSWLYMDVNPKIGGIFPQKMDGLFHGSKPYFLMEDLGVALFLETPIYSLHNDSLCLQ